MKGIIFKALAAAATAVAVLTIGLTRAYAGSDGQHLDFYNYNASVVTDCFDGWNQYGSQMYICEHVGNVGPGSWTEPPNWWWWVGYVNVAGYDYYGNILTWTVVNVPQYDNLSDWWCAADSGWQQDCYANTV